MVVCTKCHENRRAQSSTDLENMHPSFEWSLANSSWQGGRLSSHEGASGSHVCSARVLSKRARVSRAALFLIAASAVGAPLPTDGTSMASTSRNTTLENRPLQEADSRMPPHFTSFLEASLDAEPEVASENVEVTINEERQGDLEASEQMAADSERFQMEEMASDLTQDSAVPLELRGLNEMVPFLLPMGPFAPRSAGFNAEGIRISEVEAQDLQPSVRFEGPQQAAFYGPQSDELQVDDCQQFDAFLVSPLPSSVASRFTDFVQKEAKQADGMPYLHHIHGDTPAADAADGEANPRLVIEGGKVTPLWSEDIDDTPVFMMEEGTATLFRLVAPVKNAYDAVAAMMLMPIVKVDIAYGDGLLLSYRVSGDEGKQVNHQHVDGMHRPVAELDVVYKSCFSIGGNANEPIPLEESAREKESSEAAIDAWNPSKAPFPTVAELRALINKEGDLIADGSPTERVATVQTASLVFSPTFEGKAQQPKASGGQMTSLVASKPSSHLTLKEVKAGAEENVHRLMVEFRCKSEGESIVALDFSFHAYKDVQIFFKKQCAAPASSILQDPSCSSGLLSEDGSGCCLASCGTCGGDGCEDREGGLMGCCLTHIRSSALPCESSNAPCIMAGAVQPSPPAKAQELGTNLALPEEEKPRQHLRLFMGALWLLLLATSVLKFICWCLALAFLLVYLFSFCYGVHVLKEPVPVAATPSVSQLLNSVFMLAAAITPMLLQGEKLTKDLMNFSTETPINPSNSEVEGMQEG
ncbi:hypothetical protein Emag_001070 [Eimeria magna]